MDDYTIGEVLYENPLASEADVRGFRLEGEAQITFPEGRLRMANALDPALGQKSNFVYWCPEAFPADVAITWDFWPLEEPGLCILFFSARGRDGGSVFSPGLAPRTGEYNQYHHGDIDAFHISYFRRRWAEERAFHTCNLRKSYGFHMVAQAPTLPDVTTPRRPTTCAWCRWGRWWIFPSTTCPSCALSTTAPRTGRSWAAGRSACARWRPSSPSTRTSWCGRCARAGCADRRASTARETRDAPPEGGASA